LESELWRKIKKKKKIDRQLARSRLLSLSLSLSFIIIIVAVIVKAYSLCFRSSFALFVSGGEREWVFFAAFFWQMRESESEYY
jgi:hypothetical protein